MSAAQDARDPEDPLVEQTKLMTDHLNWTAKQGYILTGGGKAEEYYTAERGFPFVETDLPHYHLLQGDTHTTFSKWKSSQQPPCKLVCGAWNRPLFTGGWKHSTDQEEEVYNIQTHNLFVDLRIPKSRNAVLPPDCTSLQELTPYQLRLFARQHVFAGFTVCSEENGKPLATRHHCIDWNFVGVSRPRPNKWWIQFPKESNDNDKSSSDCSKWKELAYAKDDWGQHYYFERWERYPRGIDDEGGRLAIRLASSRKRKSTDGTDSTDAHSRPCDQPKDGILVLVGDHFNYITSRAFSGKETAYPPSTVSSLVQLVDEAVAQGDLDTARSYLSVEAGHGTVSSGWKLDCTIPPWNKGRTLSETMGGGPTFVEGPDLASCSILWNGENWELYDCSFGTIDELQKLFEGISK
ncbi:hypothetical protein IV203_030139 [Nitzschia inconspicua]|uniref:Uncharacterized protein n=1 Tax=Nitzschia inconspicua TaxID=303405 RepID=A0A9K3P8D9_9STRA|nr:hypothetical protein IV203_004907 [Nitzschia inconspicua]KAG7367468.1 hypothetical protein IV203_030139 [Nitzschia inconspicua]